MYNSLKCEFFSEYLGIDFLVWDGDCKRYWKGY